MSQQQPTKHCITLKVSASIICKYIKRAIYAIIFKRGLYPPEPLDPVEQYSIYLLLSEDQELTDFFSRVLTKSKEWILDEKVSGLSLIIRNKANKEILESWDFNVEYEDGDSVLSQEKNEKVGSIDLNELQWDIEDVLSQVVGLSSYLPALDCQCSYGLIAYSTTSLDLTEDWVEVEPVDLTNAHMIKLNTFSTGLHKIKTVVSYKFED